MATGMEWALNSVLRYMGIEPETGKKSLDDTLQIILQAGERLKQIETKQDETLALLHKLVGDDDAKRIVAATGVRYDAAESKFGRAARGPVIATSVADGRGAVFATGGRSVTGNGKDTDDGG
jgi:hypothetical protein